MHIPNFENIHSLSYTVSCALADLLPLFDLATRIGHVFDFTPSWPPPQQQLSSLFDFNLHIHYG